MEGGGGSLRFSVKSTCLKLLSQVLIGAPFEVIY